MAVKKRGNNSLKKNNKENYFSFSSDKTKKILGIILILFSIFLLLSIISYDRRDDSYLNGDEILNWAGIFGAYISNFFIKSTIGYFSIVFPLLFFTFGISFFTRITARILFHSRSEEHTSELQSQDDLVCRLMLDNKNISYDVPSFL